jgi:ParB family chromosome partitioning protein
MTTIAVNPMRCRVWALHSRLDETLSEDTCRTEIESFEKHGQQIPALGRRLRGVRDYDIELIYGARRLFVARHLNVPLLVEVRDIRDRDGIIAMDLENRLRTDISAYERGTSYDRWLREGHFKTQEEIANVLQVSSAQISRLLKLARLPHALVQAFDRPTDICEVWGAELTLLMKDADAERRMIQTARSICAVAPRPAPDAIYKALRISANSDRGSREERIVEDEFGQELFRVKQQRGSILFAMPFDIVTQELLAEVEQKVAGIVVPDAKAKSSQATYDCIASE